MSNIIKKIRGLFTNYKDNSVVPASEYNANIKALQNAIEINAEALEEQEQYTIALVEAAIPNGGLKTQHISDYAITRNKLTPALQEQTDVEAVLSDFCKDYVPSYLYKGIASNFTGPLFNSYIKALNRKLGYKPACSVSVADDNDAGWFVKYEDEELGGGKDWCNTNIENTSEAHTFDIQFGDSETGEHFFDYTGGWIVTYDLGASWTLGNLTDFININWKYTSVFGTYSNSYIDKAKSSLTKVLLKDSSNAFILNGTEPLDIREHFTINSTVKKYDDKHVTSINCTFNPKENAKFENVRYISFYINYTYLQGAGVHPIRHVDEKAVLQMPLDTLKDTIQLTQLTAEDAVPNADTLTATIQVPCKGSLEHLSIAAKINAPGVNKALTETDLQLQIPCVGVAPAPLLSAQDDEKSPTAANSNELVKSTTHSMFIAATLIEDTILEDNTHFIKWKLTPYYIVSGIPYREGAVKEMRSIFDFNGVFQQKQAIGIMGALVFDTDTQVLTPFTPGIDNVQLLFRSTITNLTINSVCVARHDSDI